MPNDIMRGWERRYIELRRPYLYVYSGLDETQLMAINLTNCRIDHKPEIIDSLKVNNSIVNDLRELFG